MRTCCLHSGNMPTSETTTLFNEKTLVKCQLVLQKRKDNNLKHADVILPHDVNFKEGFHMSCYRKFIALPKKYRIEEEVPSTSNTRAKRSLDKNTTSSSHTGIFMPICLFCNQTRKRIAGKTIELIKVTTKDFEKNIKQYAQWKMDHTMLTKISDIRLCGQRNKIPRAM